MLEINLLPEILKKQRIIIPKGLLVACGLILTVILFLWQMSVNSRLIENRERIKEIESEWKRAAAAKEELEEYEKETEKLKKKSEIVSYLMVDRILWSKKLNEISDLIIDGIWLDTLKLDNKLLLIEGNVYSENKDEMAIVGNFMNILKKDSSFFSGFSDVELKIIKRKDDVAKQSTFKVFCILESGENIKDEPARTERK